MAEYDSRIVARFWSKVDKNGPNGCWSWIGGTDSKMGYGVFWTIAKHVKPHRYSWTLANGPIPAGKFVLHRCDNPPCVNPDHLWLGTKTENNLDRDMKGRQRTLRGDGNGSSKLTTEQVVRLKRHPGTVTEISREFGISTATAWRIRVGLNWTHIPCEPWHGARPMSSETKEKIRKSWEIRRATLAGTVQ